ncbi:MAG TPA: Fur family transcriptional regulator [Pyrinomonadaceae bacterium]|nr:Fur family transcriptional regulator [Pyrinomonadaceae bacterium]
MAGSRIQGGAAGRGLTRQRRVVLGVIERSDEHLTAVEIHEAARRELPRLSFATVYNSLKFLKDSGLVREISFGSGGASRFDRVDVRHDHALCTVCGRLVDFDLKETAAIMRAAARRTRFRPEAISLTLTGVCPDCRGRQG